MPNNVDINTEEKTISATTEETTIPTNMGMQVLPKEQDRPKTKDTDKFVIADEKKKKLSRKNKKSWIKRLGEIGTIDQKDVVEFTRHLSVMLSAGVTIFEAITFLKEQSRNKVFANKLESIIDSLNNGQSLSASMSRFPKVFPKIYTSIIAVGEQSGSLPETMLDLSNHLEENERFKNKVKGALIYPKIILSVMGAFLLVLFLFVMPRILTVFESLKADIPATTKFIIALTDFIQNNIFLLIIVVVGTIIATKLLLRNEKMKKMKDLFYIKVPLVGHIVLNYNTTQTAQHFGALFASGLTIVKCLEITENVVANRVFKEEIRYMIEKIKNGSSFSQSFKENSHFPPMFVKLIRVGERTGKLPQVVEYMRNYYKGLVDADVKNISTIIEPAIMVILGLMVAGLVITVIGPIYQLISNVGQ
ncbi:type II secretion system F family protein [Candidatus Peregrinibacteria bacterium]|nr:type II secretion system F family protein [Candidatus Peregrinibacteria bacterium]